jgi:hypothetical protein
MIKVVEVDPDESLTRRWGIRADDVRVKRTMAALEANGITVLRASDAAAAKLSTCWVSPNLCQRRRTSHSRLEDARAQAMYGVRSAVSKVLVINREITPGRITVVLVDEVLGF